ncbi:MAG: type III pantothenate kinase [Bacteroidia bacterium]|nr:type III pantothenate kinase [Bacteroidia bacterium]NNC86480.1 type III pantothenate kinase [Bacteroidia bacterium]NNM16873.1 type III pantothenate kinase [Bacteroidia bacterium]
MNYVIDIGNTKTKTAFVNKKNVSRVKTFDTDEFMKIYRQHFGTLKAFDNCIVSSVIPLRKGFQNYLNKNIGALVLNNKTKLPFKNLYKTKKTLGNDRIANVAGAMVLFPKKSILAIDAGSCITFDLMNARKQYLGGAISPGLHMRFSALNKFTSGLPLIKLNKKAVKSIGNTTASSILSGVQNGTLLEIDAFINDIKSSYSDIKLILCGGDSSFLADRLKNSIFVSPNLTLIGLNFILDYNRKTA